MPDVQKSADGRAFTVDIPTVEDVFTFAAPFTDDEEAKRERIRRWKTARSPIPDSVAWIPPLINWLDDIQDLLVVGLFLGRPILRRLPLRLLGPVGWALTVNDALNLATNLLTPLTFPAIRTKANYEKQLKKLFRKRPARLAAVAAFAKKYPIGSFVLQAGQVTDQLFGHGIRLGPVFGAASDVVFGAIRAAFGERVVIRTPPISDMTWTQWQEFVRNPTSQTDAFTAFSVLSARVLAQSAAAVVRPDLFTDAEHAAMLAGINMAIGGVAETQDETQIEGNAEIIADSKLPLWLRTDPATIEAFKKEGLQIDVVGLHYYERPDATTTLRSVAESLFHAAGDYGSYMNQRDVTGPMPPWLSSQMFHDGDTFLWENYVSSAQNHQIFTPPWQWTLNSYAKGGHTVTGSGNANIMMSFYMAVATAMRDGNFCADWKGWSQWIFKQRDLALRRQAFGDVLKHSWEDEKFLGTGFSCRDKKLRRSGVDYDKWPGWPDWFRTQEVDSVTKTQFELGWGATLPDGSRWNIFDDFNPNETIELPD